MKMMLDNWQITLGIGSILFIAGFVWFSFRKGMKVRVEDDDVKSKRSWS